MRRLVMALAGLLVVGSFSPLTLRAQVGAADNRPAGRQARMQLESLFLARVKSDLGLSDEVASKLTTVLRETARTRRDLEEAERELKGQLRDQLRPGIAANNAVVQEVLDKLLANRVEYAESFRTEMKRLGGILTPVQQGQYFMMREALMQRIQELIEKRATGAGRGRLGGP